MGFLGKKIYSSYQFMSGTYSPWFWGDTVADEAQEIPADRNGGIFSVDIYDTQILFGFNDTGVFTNFQPNGSRLVDKYGSLNPILGVELRTNMHGLGRGDINWSADNIFVDWRGTSFTPDTYVTLTIKFKVFTIEGTDQNNMLKGVGGYDESFLGHKGADKLFGGNGADIFMFSTGDSGNSKSTSDTIMDFDLLEHDLIDLRRWDANSKALGLQDFDFIGTAAFSKEAGQLHVQKQGGDTLVQGDTNGDGKADFTIWLKGSVMLTEDQFLI